MGKNNAKKHASNSPTGLLHPKTVLSNWGYLEPATPAPGLRVPRPLAPPYQTPNPGSAPGF